MKICSDRLEEKCDSCYAMGTSEVSLRYSDEVF